MWGLIWPPFLGHKAASSRWSCRWPTCPAGCCRRARSPWRQKSCWTETGPTGCDRVEPCNGTGLLRSKEHQLHPYNRPHLTCANFSGRYSFVKVKKGTLPLVLLMASSIQPNYFPSLFVCPHQRFVCPLYTGTHPQSTFHCSQTSRPYPDTCSCCLVPGGWSASHLSPFTSLDNQVIPSILLL